MELSNAAGLWVRWKAQVGKLMLRMGAALTSDLEKRRTRRIRTTIDIALRQLRGGNLAESTDCMVANRLHSREVQGQKLTLAVPPGCLSLIKINRACVLTRHPVSAALNCSNVASLFRAAPSR